MEQLTFFNYPYKYLIDASSVFAQKDTDKLPRKIHRSLWSRIDKGIEDKLITTCSEIEEEVKKDDVVAKWLKQNQCFIFPIDDDIQYNVRKIVTEHPRMISFSDKNGSSSGDAFLIATAMKYNLIVITEESKEKQNKIPQICDYYGVRTLNLTELCMEEGWVF